MTTGEKITSCRKKLGITQAELANELGVTRQAVSRWESDLAFPETDTLMKMSKLFSVTCDWLLNYNSSGNSEKEDIKDGEGARPEKNFYFNLKNFAIEYKSKAHIGNLPLVHINIGFGRTAKGVFAVGIKSVGVVSVGLFCAGIISCGTFALGILSLGTFALGLFSAGAVAVGLIALGAVAIGLYSMGAVAIGLFAVGAYANGFYIAVGDVAAGGIALGGSKADGSVMSVILPQFNEMKDAIFREFENVPKFWGVFVSWCKGMFELMYL